MSRQLTKEQKEIVEFYGAPLRILAGPGTGKTMCLVEKVKFLIKEKKVAYTEISLLTFTKAAASELRGRIEKSGMDSDKLPYVNTLHGLAMSILNKNFSKANLKTGFQPISSNFTTILMRDVVYELKIGGTFLSPDQIKIYRDAHFRQKANAKLPPEIKSSRSAMAIVSLFSSTFREHLEFYNALDWTDILLKTMELLDKNSEVKNEVHASTKHLLVDEYQDLSPLEQEFIAKINSDKAGLCVVGDDDQSIYETFRFADPGGLIDFLEKYPEGKSLPMSICWRCPPDVVKVALELIKNNSIRADKDLKAANKDKKGFVVCLSHKSKKKEIEWTIAKVVEIKSKGYKYEDIMILFTDGKIAKDYISELEKNKIPLNIQLKVAGIFESENFLALNSALKLLVDSSDNLNVRYCLYTWKGIGTETVRQLRLLSVSLKINLWEVIEKVSDNLDSFRNIRQRNKVKEFYDFYKTLIGTSKFKTLVEIYLGKFPESKNDEGCKVFFETLEKFNDKEDVISLKEVVDDFEQKVESGELDSKHKEKEEGVKIMTMHSAKGCEGQIVIIPALEDDILPGSAKNVEEKRRLFYVSITRAQVGVYLNWASQRSGQEIHIVAGRRMLSKTKSRFLEEIATFI